MPHSSATSRLVLASLQPRALRSPAEPQHSQAGPALVRQQPAAGTTQPSERCQTRSHPLASALARAQLAMQLHRLRALPKQQQQQHSQLRVLPGAGGALSRCVQCSCRAADKLLPVLTKFKGCRQHQPGARAAQQAASVQGQQPASQQMLQPTQSRDRAPRSAARRPARRPSQPMQLRQPSRCPDCRDLHLAQPSAAPLCHRTRAPSSSVQGAAVHQRCQVQQCQLQ